MRDRILQEAERLFRAYGYAKTTVADIAAACAMSPANVYRFFESKAVIHEALTEVILQRMEVLASNIARERRPAAERLRKLLVDVHRATCEQYLEDAKVHEVCTKAMAEQWGVIEAHIQRMHAIISALVADGGRGGEFAAHELESRAQCVFNAAVPFWHPQVVAERFVEDHGRQAAQMADFVIEALRMPPPRQAPRRRRSSEK